MCNRCVEFDGKRWHSYSGFYLEYRGTKRLKCVDRDRLHRAVWKSVHGPIKDGCEIHHIDGDIFNNNISNLECHSKGEHRSLHVSSAPIAKADWANKPKVPGACKSCGATVYSKMRKKNLSCLPCRRANEAEWRAKAKSARLCKQCGGEFISFTGHYCSQRCVNLGARWRRDGLQPASAG